MYDWTFVRLKDRYLRVDDVELGFDLWHPVLKIKKYVLKAANVDKIQSYSRESILQTN